MIIVTQDKRMMINFNNVNVIRVANGKIYSYDNTYGREIDADLLGCYKNDQRAKEVLREIANRYAEYYQIKGGHSVLNNGGYIQPNMFDFPKVYEMPAE